MCMKRHVAGRWLIMGLLCVSLAGNVCAIAPQSAVRMSAWAQAEVDAAYQNGLVNPAFNLGTDYKAKITREQFARLTVELIAYVRQTTSAAMAEEYGIALMQQEVDDAAADPALGNADAAADPALGNADAAADPALGNADAAADPALGNSDAAADRVTNSLFSDTDSLYIALAAQLGVVQGEKGLFRPHDGIRRCEAAAMLQRCMAALGCTQANSAPAIFTDAWEMPRWSVEPIKFVSGRTTTAGVAVMSGAEGRFAPRELYTIEEAIMSVARCYESLDATQVNADWRTAQGYDTMQFTFTAGGDCTFGRGANFSYRGSFDEMYDRMKSPSYFFENIAEFHNDDLTMVNFEGTLTTATRAASKTFVFRGRPEYANILTAGSIDAVTIANNHSKDYLQQGYEDTLRNLSAAVAVSGYEQMPIVTVKGVRVGFASNVGWAFDAAQKRFITGAVKDLRSRGAEIVVFNYHWGIEREYRSNATQRAIARYCIDSGADLVIGHHPHVVQEVETYKGKQIAYSLGNLSFGGNANPVDKNCLIFQQVFTIDLNTRQIIESSYRAVPYKISSVSYRNDYRPTSA